MSNFYPNSIRNRSVTCPYVPVLVDLPGITGKAFPFTVSDWHIHYTWAGGGEFKGQPLKVLGPADGRTACVAFSDLAEVAMANLENQAVRYFPATRTGAGAFTIGLSNNVCH